jgi:hypothetical protein
MEGRGEEDPRLLQEARRISIELRAKSVEMRAGSKEHGANSKERMSTALCQEQGLPCHNPPNPPFVKGGERGFCFVCFAVLLGTKATT